MRKEAFTLSVADSVLDDLRDRLARTRFPRDFANDRWEYGTNTAYLKELVEYWRDRFDWRAVEREINSYPNYR
ncbi:MAG TPA: epoxide hydrolase N-terminal domain-containing protein, partial [Candidatus Binataceae bacterium]|nr:epoxide hydrolase N-terminal domain-containing protein [Candidatus Binataceae bacterium]